MLRRSRRFLLGALPRRQAPFGATLLVSLLISACAGLSVAPVTPGDTANTVLQRLGPPTAQYKLPSGEWRFEYSGGPYAVWTLMVDIDAQGFVLGAENVRTEAHFNRVQPGITLEQLRWQLGTPSWVWRVRYHDQTVWSYRYQGPFTCLVFHVGITPLGVVEDTSYGLDPACEVPSDRMRHRR